MDAAAIWLLKQEGRALFTRVNLLKPFALHQPMVPAAAISPSAQRAIERYLARERHALRSHIQDFLSALDGKLRDASPAEAQRQFSLLRLKFNAVLSQFDIFADALTQRSSHDIGVWLAGLDSIAADALALPGYYQAPPVICYLDHGIGAAIRRARTRLPGGSENPVAIIRIPRERMIGSGIASSLVHEVGHQAAALLDLIQPLRLKLQQHQSRPSRAFDSWIFWERWISEILADFWSVARLGIASTLGLIGVMSLPAPFVLRVGLDDPHPIPWLRVKLSCAMGQRCYPHPQWAALAKLWESFYPLDAIPDEKRQLLRRLEGELENFLDVLFGEKFQSLNGATLLAVMDREDRQPAHLLAQYQQLRDQARQLSSLPPCLAFAMLGQAKAGGLLEPETESHLLNQLLTHWALRHSLLSPADQASSSHARESIPIPSPVLT